MFDLMPFQQTFLDNATRPDIRTAALSLPRGNGKSSLAGYLATRILTPGDDLFRPGKESVLLAASYKQARIVYRFARDMLEPQGIHHFTDSSNRVMIEHRPTKTRLDLYGSNAKAAMGLVNCPWVIADEPGAWEVNAGTLMFDAIRGAQGKPGSPLKALYIGTLAPALGGWWHDMITTGSNGSTYVQALRGERARWDQWAEIRRCNPLMSRFPESRAVLLEERNDARKDSRLKAQFISYRLNLPTADESQVLLTVEDWERVCSRDVPPREGRPIFAYDLGGGRAWSAAVAIWPNWRIEAIAVAPGIPSVERQEQRDRVPRGTYSNLVGSSLTLATGFRVPPVSLLHETALQAFGRPRGIICDRFRLNDLRDCVHGIPIDNRVTQWSEAAADIRAVRKAALDGELSAAPGSRPIIAASLAVAMVENDKAGNCRLIKRDPANNTGRDDVASALTLAVGAQDRHPAPRARPRLRLVGA